MNDEVEAARKAGFRAPMIGGGMGGHRPGNPQKADLIDGSIGEASTAFTTLLSRR